MKHIMVNAKNMVHLKISEAVEIRKAEFKDIPCVIEIERESFDDPWPEQAFFSCIENTFVAQINGKIVGYIIISKVLDEVNIDNIAVKKEYRRNKIGSLLMNFVLQNNPGCSFFLEVRPSNVSAISFYKKFGFREIYRRKNYYRNEDAIVMARYS